MWLARRSAPTVITRTLRMLARPTATMVRAGSLAEYLSAQVPGTTVGDIPFTDAPMLAALWAHDLTDADLTDMVQCRGEASQGTARSEASMAEGSAAAANPVIESTGN